MAELLAAADPAGLPAGSSLAPAPTAAAFSQPTHRRPVSPQLHVIPHTPCCAESEFSQCWAVAPAPASTSPGMPAAWDWSAPVPRLEHRADCADQRYPRGPVLPEHICLHCGRQHGAHTGKTLLFVFHSDWSDSCCLLHPAVVTSPRSHPSRSQCYTAVHICTSLAPYLLFRHNAATAECSTMCTHLPSATCTC